MPWMGIRASLEWAALPMAGAGPQPTICLPLNDESGARSTRFEAETERRQKEYEMPYIRFRVCLVDDRRALGLRTEAGFVPAGPAPDQGARRPLTVPEGGWNRPLVGADAGNRRP